MVVGDGGVSGEEEGVGKIVATSETGSLEVEDGGDEEDAVEGDAFVDY